MNEKPMCSASPRVSVIIPAYNCAQFLREAINSVLEQTYQDFEVVLVDDGSTDHTFALVQDYTNQYPQKIRYIYQKNSGVAAARNTGIENANGEYIALLDADDVWLPSRLMDGVAVLDANPDTGLTHGNMSLISEEGEPLFVPVRDKKYLSGKIFTNIFLRTADITCLTVLLRKKCFHEVGLFDSNPLVMGCEDREMWLRISRKYQIQYIDKILGLYRFRPGSVSRNRERMLTARYYVVDKSFPPGQPFHFLRLRALSKIHRDEGDSFLLTEQFRKARYAYTKALSFWPLHIWTWINLLKAAFHWKPKNSPPLF